MRSLHLVLVPAGLAAVGAVYFGAAGPGKGDAAVAPTAEMEPHRSVGAGAGLSGASEGAREQPVKAAGVGRAEVPAGQAAAQSAVVAVPVGAGRTGVDAREVTVGAFEACVAAGACAMEHVTVIAGSTCNYEASGRGAHPMNCVDWFGAEQYCQFAGARLCRADEWFAACRGPGDQDYPYGATYDTAACNVVASVGPLAEHGTVPVGSAAGCEGGYPGLRDMVGNVSEWVDDCNGDYCKFYGGAFTTNEPLEDFASCKHFCAGNKKAFRSSTIGIRCCRDQAPAGP